jgi:hypothetical protein
MMDEYAEAHLDRVVEEISKMALREGMTIAVSASIPVGRLHYTRVMAQSSKPGEYGKRLILSAMEQMESYRAALSQKGISPDDLS